jgi:protein TonB
MPGTGAQREETRRWRLFFALLASLAVHIGVIFGVRLVPAQPAPEVATMIQARLEMEPDIAVSSAPAVTQTAPAKAAPAPEAANRIRASEAPAPAPVVQPKPERKTPALAGPASDSGHETPDSGHGTALQDRQSALPKVAIPLFEDPTYYPVKQLDERPQVKQQVNPVYPDVAALENVEGEVTLLLLIDETGKVREVSVVEAKPEGYFEESAMAAFRSAEFTPAVKQGRRVKSRVMIRVQFNLTQKP